MPKMHNKLQVARQSRQALAAYLSSEQPIGTSVENALKLGELKALDLFHKAAKDVPAYRNFLHTQGVRPAQVCSFGDFLEVPPTTKENYIAEYSLADRMWKGSITGAYQVSLSSGTSGKPTLWPQNLAQAIEGARTHESLFKMFEMDSKSTLLINGFALGSWVAGTFTLMCTSLANWKGYQVSLVNTGYNLEEVITALVEVSPQFEQTVICGFAPFLKEILEAIVQQKPQVLATSKVRFLSTGQAITEEWRSYLQELLAPGDSQTAIYNLYGSADAALMGFETPATVEFRKYLSQFDDSLLTFFGKGRLPSVYAFDPSATYFEAPQNELWITKYSSAPLIRYNIHDEGGVLLPDAVDQILRAKDSNLSLKSNLPFVYLFGRDKFMVKVYGANVYSEQVQRALSHQRLQAHISGKFQMEVVSDSEMNSKLVFHLELSSKAQHSEELVQVIQDTVVAEVCRLSSEYRYVYKQLGEKVIPRINLYAFGEETRFPKGKVIKNV